ncbi:phragmoplast orienting kinesin 2 isoform X2 [Tasmannia lanceolata]|uniref:phragmoplast orienting kinesin 2 isoform X2 n=1 Tax=Tasmannia lanceolata TaxID=3420 RepID=UPI004063EEBA
MMRDLRIFRRNSGKNSHTEGNENLPLNPADTSLIQPIGDSSRAPLNAISESFQKPKPDPEQELGLKTKTDKTPSKNKVKVYDRPVPFRTPDKLGVTMHGRTRFGWAQKNESGSNCVETRDDIKIDVCHGLGHLPPPPSRGVSLGNSGLMTPRSVRTGGRAMTSHSECSSTQSTPTKSVTKPPMATRTANFYAMSKGFALSSVPSMIVNTVEVPYFELREDPSFWMDHNVQVLIRVRPLNSMERSVHGYNRCLKQESAQSITWIGQTETRFTFDHVACETINQEMLFRVAGLPMVENCMSGYNSCMFAYGQTGSGKTYTMLGEIDELEVRPSTDRGMTPRIFEFLFARIRAEEESRRDEKLKYNCKCSFLEIYNEQITDLLDPSSTNLLLREDTKKGVYVENLTEIEVETVNDILRLLLQGAANRKVAATNMNRESSRSHSVFTCVIESQWEKDSATNLRFARLNLVDLAGSERQKTSGAEGERLKEAANINKSLSTLGHVIMILVDVAHGKQRHVPYRDSRLTFLLQDSLGGNSKTMVIANVSPSISCAGETLSTLKFAQRAKLIQNNAVVNEDASGDIVTLQHQIRLLKEELSLLKRQNVSRSLSFRSTIFGDSGVDAALEDNMLETASGNSDDLSGCASPGIVRVSTKQLKSLETILAGALRREQMADTAVKQLEAEIEQLNRLVRQREEDTRCTKMMLKFREDKIGRMESLLGGLMPADSYLLEQNSALSDEIQLLQTRVDKNPEVTRFALENIRLLDQLRRFQDFYTEGEREILLTEVSELRDQLLEFFEGKPGLDKHPKSSMGPQDIARVGFASATKEKDLLYIELKKTREELDDCRNNFNSCLEINAKLTREIDDLHYQLNNLKSAFYDHDANVKPQKDPLLGFPTKEDQTFETLMHGAVQGKAAEQIHENENIMKHAEEIMNLQLELDILKSMLEEERLSRGEAEEKALYVNNNLKIANERCLQISKQYEHAVNQLKEAKSVIEALESQQILSINELEELRESINQYFEIITKQEEEITILKKVGSEHQQLRDHPLKNSEGEDSPLQTKLKRMKESLEKARRLNMRYQSDQVSQTSHEQEMDEVRSQVEAETAEVIVCLQEELATLQQQVDNSNTKELKMKQSLILLENELKELRGRLCSVAHDNERLGELLDERDEEIRSLNEEWERLSCEVADVLADGHVALEDASDEVDFIAASFPQRRTWIGDQVERMIRTISEKELMIEELQKCLEDAQNIKNDMEWKLRSLRGATLAITESQQQESDERRKEVLLLKSQLTEKMLIIDDLENKIKIGEDQIRKAEICATVAFMTVKRLSEINLIHVEALKQTKIQLNKSVVTAEAEKQIEALKLQLEGSEVNIEELKLKLAEEKECVRVVETKLEKVERDCAESRISNDLLKTKEKLDEFKMGVSTLSSCMNEFVELVGGPEKVETPGKKDFTCEGGDTKGKAEIETTQDPGDRELHDVSVACSSTVSSMAECYLFNVTKNTNDIHSGEQEECDLGKASGSSCDRDFTILLLKKEIESALDSLRAVQAQMFKLLAEKEEVKKSEKESQKRIECLAAQLLTLQREMCDREKQFESRTMEFDQKVQTVEEMVDEANACWRKAKESKEALELELSNTRVVAAQKTAEASSLLANFMEAQETMKEADEMVNALMAANDSAKLEIERHKKIEASLTNERDFLTTEVQSLLSCNNLKKQQYDHLEKQFHSNLEETRNLVQVLEDILMEVQATFNEESKLIIYDIQGLKNELLYSTNLTRTWLEDIWSEIIGKDCAMSVLHHCHIGILLESVTGLNAENGFLHHGLCESNSVIAELREHNFRTKRELEMCSILKGKLLVDIKNSFNRITRKEDEAGKISAKLSSFEKKILDLQLMEETMLARSNSMGSELAMLMKELDLSNKNALTTLLDQNELIMIDLSAKDLELLILASELKEKILELNKMLNRTVELETDRVGISAILEGICEQMIFIMIDEQLEKQISMDNLREVSDNANKKIRNITSEMEIMYKKFSHERKFLQDEVCLLQNLISRNQNSLDEKIKEVTEVKVSYNIALQEVESKSQEMEIQIEQMSNMACENCTLKGQLSDAIDSKERLSAQVQVLKTEMERIIEDMQEKDTTSGKLSALEDENGVLKNEVQNLKAEHSRVLEDLRGKSSEVEYSSSRLLAFDQQNCKLQDKIYSLEGCIASVQTDLDMKNSDLEKAQCYYSVTIKELDLKTQELEHQINTMKALKGENDSLKNELVFIKKKQDEALTLLSLNLKHCSDSVQAVGTIAGAKDEKTITLLDKMFRDICDYEERASKFMAESECLEISAKELMSEKLAIHAELARKDEILKGMSFDLSLLQESASNAKDQKDEFEEMMVILESLENDLELRTTELDEAVNRGQMVESQLQDKVNIISALELELAREHGSLKLVSDENLELKAKMEDLLANKHSIEEDLAEKTKLNERLDEELLKMSSSLVQMDYALEDLKNNLSKVTMERNSLDSEILALKEQVDMAQALAEENEAIATEARQIAEARKTYAEDKEEEVKLLERSVEELECTVNVLENKVEIVKGEAERQRLQREELEIELQAVRHQMLTVQTSGAILNSEIQKIKRGGGDDMPRDSEEKLIDLQKAHKQIQLLEKSVAEKDAEIVQCKAHISELNIHAEAQAREYKQKFKALESMAQEVKSEPVLSHVLSSTTTRSEKTSVKSRGSGSPFKCIGLGLAQQINSEKEEELIAGRHRIEELEALLASRQKEIFMLNTRLAAAESMTHDVIRDLLGVKLDMTNYALLFDHQQVQKITDKARIHGEESLVKDQVVVKLKQQLNEFIEERQGWLDEINRRHAELVALQIASEKLRQRDQFLTTENEMLKVDNANHKKKVMELENEVKKLSGQQNLQQRIHHHAKIKEENNSLKIQNEDLSAKLQRTEGLLSRVKEEVARYRASCGKNPYVDMDEEQRLKNKLQDSEEERVQLAQKLLSLCTSILKAAGVTRPMSDISPSVAEEAVIQLKDRITSLESELLDLKFKGKISSEKIRLSELRLSSPLSSRTNENCPTPRRL